MRVRRPSLAKSWKMKMCAKSELGEAEIRDGQTDSIGPLHKGDYGVNVERVVN